MRVSTLLLFTLITLVSPALAGDEKKGESRLLTQVDSFPEELREALRVVSAFLAARGEHPEEYYAWVSREKDGLWEISLRHQSHPVEKSSWRGDACSRCRIAFYDPKTGKVLRLQGIR
jgi:hypothetical protein